MPQNNYHPKRRFDRFSTENEARLVCAAINEYFPGMKASYTIISNVPSFTPGTYREIAGEKGKLSECEYAVDYNGTKSILPVLAQKMLPMIYAMQTGNWDVPMKDLWLIRKDKLFTSRPV